MAEASEGRFRLNVRCGQIQEVLLRGERLRRFAPPEQCHEKLRNRPSVVGFMSFPVPFSSTCFERNAPHSFKAGRIAQKPRIPHESV